MVRLDYANNTIFWGNKCPDLYAPPMSYPTIHCKSSLDEIIHIKIVL